LYGFTAQGGAHGLGTVFAMTLGGNFVTVHSFTEPESFGVFGAGPLMQGRDGALYGISEGSFPIEPSVVFRITLGGVYTTLTAIQDAHGVLVQGADGNFYGTTSPTIPVAFPGVQGSVFRMTPAGVVTTLAEFICDDFLGPCPNGANPAGRLVAT